MLFMNITSFFARGIKMAGKKTIIPLNCSLVAGSPPFYVQRVVREKVSVMSVIFYITAVYEGFIGADCQGMYKTPP